MGEAEMKWIQEGLRSEYGDRFTIMSFDEKLVRINDFVQNTVQAIDFIRKFKHQSLISNPLAARPVN